MGEAKTDIEPMVENKYKSFSLEHRFDTGFCTRANTRFAPTFDLDHRLKKYTRTEKTLFFIAERIQWMGEAKTDIEPMVENKYKSFAFGHRFDTGFCSRANIRFAPTFVLDDAP